MYYLYLDLLYVKNHIFKYPTLKLTHWPLENGLFNQQNSSKNRLFSRDDIKKTYYTSFAICFC